MRRGKDVHCKKEKGSIARHTIRTRRCAKFVRLMLILGGDSVMGAGSDVALPNDRLCSGG